MPAYYDNWREQQYSCSNCCWQGLGSQLVHGEAFDDLFEVNCPVCRDRLVVVTYPTLEESRSRWGEVSPEDKLIVQHVERSISQQPIGPTASHKLTPPAAPAPVAVASVSPPAASAEIPALRTALYAAAVLLALGALPLGNAYYFPLRLVAVAAFASIAYLAYGARHWPAVIVPLFLLVLFNPVFPVHLSKAWWASVDVGSAAYVAVLSKYAATRFADLGPVPLKVSGVLMSCAMAAFTGIFAATALALLFFLASVPLEWLGRPIPFKTLSYLFWAAFAGGVVHTLVGLAYHLSCEKGDRAA